LTAGATNIARFVVDTVANFGNLFGTTQNNYSFAVVTSGSNTFGAARVALFGSDVVIYFIPGVSSTFTSGQPGALANLTQTDHIFF